MVSEQIYAALAALVGGRVYKRVAEQEAEKPYIVYYYASVSEEPFVDAGNLIQRYRVGLNLYDTDSDSVDQLHDAVVVALRNLPEFLEQNIGLDGFEPETNLHTWTLDFTFRDA